MKKFFVLILSLIAVVLFSANLFAAPKEVAGKQFKPKVIKIDRNYDGVAERVEIYDEKGAIIRVEVDIDADGKIDEWVYYTNGVAVKGEKDINKDGKPDTVVIYDGKGVIIRTESDSNGDGKIDEWVYFTNGAPSKAEKDTNGDGKVDTWLNY